MAGPRTFTCNLNKRGDGGMGGKFRVYDPRQRQPPYIPHVVHVSYWGRLSLYPPPGPKLHYDMTILGLAMRSYICQGSLPICFPPMQHTTSRGPRRETNSPYQIDGVEEPGKEESAPFPTRPEYERYPSIADPITINVGA